MEKIDLKDRKILYELDNNSRQSSTKIAKKVGLHKNVVAYRIKQLKEKGVIKNFYTLIDTSKLGYLTYRLYMSYQNTNPEIEKEIISYFVNNKYTFWGAPLEGRYDFGVLIWVKDIKEFQSFYEEMLRRYDEYFDRKILSIYVQAQHYPYSFLLSDNYRKSDRLKFLTTGGSKKVDNIDDIDLGVLKLIAQNARLPTVEIAKQLGSSITVVNYRIQKLINLGVIRGFKMALDFPKIGYQDYKVDIWLNDHNQKDAIINYLTQNPYFLMLHKTIGYGDIEINICAKGLSHLHSMIEDLTSKFHRFIRKHRYFYVGDWFKYNYMPEE